ncbi:MAG TPA: ABC transporter ATP-binding protein [Brevundimonas sp.]|uniref:ABC transporter ATP-binding protein n=1 Tax=Brevundimonas sp. TaxID=1871086 RepID=UPI002BE92026|nr:ABC transporter ATP-binding protein [Brevundimonas sp.]HRH20413.1 ABC transporter ATP-binding protein [Brevundimonas sp.]
MSAAPAEMPRRPMLARIWRDYLKPRRGQLALALLAAAAAAGLTALLAAELDPAVQHLLVDHDPRALIVIPLTIAVLAIARGAFQVMSALLVNRIGHGVVGAVQVQLFGRMIRSDLAQLRSQHSGAYVASVLFDANLIREAFTQGVVNYVQHGLIVIALLIYLVFLDPLLAGIVIVAAPVAGVVLRRFAKRTRKAAQGAMEETSALSTAVMENLDGVRVVQIDGREADEEARVAAVVARRQTHVIKGANARAAAAPVTESLTMIVVAAVLAYAGWRAANGGLTVGQFTAFIASLMIVSQSLRQLANLQTVMSEGLTAAARLFAALDIQPTITDQPGAQTLQAGSGDLSLEGVSFAYGPHQPVLADVSLTARRGQSIALVGPSGGGKSTILSLIPRFYDAGEGRVAVNGQNVRDVTLASLRSQIALVTQEPFLFDDTVAANIAYARPGATQDQIEAAARDAAAHDFIQALPEGYDTRVGEAGSRLSGGQRQRIAIARAFLKDSPILLLDEATSALDTESEAQVQAALERLMAGRTTLMIAHRLSTVKSADRIYVIDKGRVVESGTHTALVKKGGLYARLARSQSLEGTPA